MRFPLVWTDGFPSVGLAVLPHENIQNIDGLTEALTHADQMLYHVKKHGKGRFMVYDSPNN